jgi:hypothetical protein
MTRFVNADRLTDHLLPPSVEEWLPEDHLARFFVEVVDGLDLSALVNAYRGRCSEVHHPSGLLGLLVYGNATGTFSSRKFERVTYDSVAFRYIAADAPPGQNFGANAAWLRLNVMLYNVLSLLKRIGLPAERHSARPKRLRFLIFNTIGRVIRHGGDTLLRLSCALRRRPFDAIRLAIPPPPRLAGE